MINDMRWEISHNNGVDVDSNEEARDELRVNEPRGKDLILVMKSKEKG